MRPPSLLLLLLSLLTTASFAVDQTKFRTCSQTGFCKRHRSHTPVNTYTIAPATITPVPTAPNTYHTRLHPSISSLHPSLLLTIAPLATGAFNVRVVEDNTVTPRWESKDIVVDGGLGVCEDVKVAETTEMFTITANCGATPSTVTITTSGTTPFTLTLSTPAATLLTINSNSLFHYEHRRNRANVPAATIAPDGTTEEDRHGGKEIVGYWEDGLAIYKDGTREVKHADRVATGKDGHEEDESGMWEEHFHEHKDSKPNGPMSVGFDVEFYSTDTHLTGIPEHAAAMDLLSTRSHPASTTATSTHYNEPYRLYNLDVFEYDLDVPMALYGAIPLMVAHDTVKNTVCGVFFNNPSEMFVDVYESAEGGKGAHWIAESGVIDLFLLPGAVGPKEFYRQYTSITGTPALPPMFSLGYHQCRWNYKDEKDVAMVHGKFEEHDFPYDVLWLDIEHTDGKRYFTWDKHLFPTPARMQQELWKQGRRMVTIVDPHIKRDGNYRIHQEAENKGLYVKREDGVSDFEGWCWPGSSGYLDFTDTNVRDWWAKQFAYDKYIGSTPSLFTWNDMNEMSVFNGPEVTMQKTTKNLAGVEHREWHNIYGMLFQRATAEGLVARNTPANDRPFVLSRSFYAGSQRWGAIWTGDNAARWDHLAIAAPMLLTIGSAGLPFAGADVGGFFGNCDAELMTRWMQAGAYQPFFRGHAHHDSARREPWLFGDETLGHLRSVSMERYQLLPTWYSLFEESSRTGLPVMRPMWMVFGTDANSATVDSQWMVGEALMVCPVVEQGKRDVNCYFVEGERWYDVRELNEVGLSGWNRVKADLGVIPVYQRGGSIVTRKMRLRRSSETMKADPVTLYVALDGNGGAAGELYVDDEKSYDYERGLYCRRTFKMENGALVGSKSEGDLNASNWVERIVVLGMKGGLKRVVMGGGQELEFNYDAERGVAVVRKPDLMVSGDAWTVKFEQ